MWIHRRFITVLQVLKFPKIKEGERRGGEKKGRKGEERGGRK